MSVSFIEVSVVFLIVFFLAYVLSKLKQPPLIGYIGAGVLLGPLFLDMLTASGLYEMFSHIGVAFLLFLVGLHLNISLIREVGKIAVLTGVGQIVITISLAFSILFFLDIPTITAFILSIGLAFSSTIIIVKLLSDKNALETLYGKISLGFLLVQDFVAVFVLLSLGTFISFSQGGSIAVIGYSLLIAILVAILLFVVTKPLVAYLFKKNEASEIIFLFAVAWCFGFAALYDVLGFSLEIGALLAGASLASTRFNHEIAARIKPLRDFFIILFFIVLGSQVFTHSIDTMGEDVSLLSTESQLFDDLTDMIPLALALSALVVIGNPLIVMGVMRFMGYTTKTGFMSGLAVSQISEFSLIIGMLSVQAGLITTLDLSLLTLIMIITVFCSSYLFYHGEQIYSLLRPILSRFDPQHSKDSTGIVQKPYEYLFIGLNSFEERKLVKLKQQFDKLVVIESSSKRISILKKHNVPYVFGDISNIEFLNEFQLEALKVCVSFRDDFYTNYMLVSNIRRVNNSTLIVVLAEDETQAMKLYSVGADYVVIPDHINQDWVLSILEEGISNKELFTRRKQRHYNKIKHMLEDEL